MSWPFELDRFQQEAIDALDAGRSVLVAAPTGSGKTVIAEHAVDLALASGKRVFYTAPIKALSNQKYGDLASRLGTERVGLLTGDNAINGDADVVVMTTEVLRNMIYAGTDLRDLGWVVLDEVHYLQDAYRGPVWEEVIIHAPPWVKLVCLSATVSNADELADWIGLVRGACDVVFESERPVRLEHLFSAADRQSDKLWLVPTLVDGRPNPEGARFDVAPQRIRVGKSGRPRQRFATPRRVDVIDELAARELVPALYFIFSRAACDDAVQACLNGGVRLLATPAERQRVRTIAEEHVRNLDDADLDVLGYPTWLAGLEAGLAAHHAGMVPPFKEAVEACFAEGLVKVVFATETLALGVNMPARTVVIERLTKFNGERHDTLTPGEYTQLTGRAGRRGIDPIGHAVVLWSPFTTFEDVASLASSRSFFLRSAFRPTYNMAANLIRRYGQADAGRLLNRSFAQYQADRSVVRLQQRLADRRVELDRLRQSLPVDAEQLAEYRALRREAETAGTPDAAERRAIETAVARLLPGMVIRLDHLRREPAVVLTVGQRRNGIAKAKALTAAGRVLQVHPDDFDRLPVRLGQVELPKPFSPYDRRFQSEVAKRLQRLLGGQAKRARAAAEPDPDSSQVAGQDQARRAQDLWDRAAAHPLASHAQLDQIMRQGGRIERAEREVADLTRRVDTVVDSVARRFERLRELLAAWGYVDGWSLTARGRLLASCYHESDLLVVESLACGLLDGVDAATLAALVSCFTYEHRSRNVPQQTWLPSSEARSRYADIGKLARDLNVAEEQAGLPLTRPPDATFAALAFAWASGGDLDEILEDEELSGGDFVRNVKQLLDLCRQLGDLAPVPQTARAARQAADMLLRGVVAASSVLEVTAPPAAEPPLPGGPAVAISPALAVKPEVATPETGAAG